MLLYGPPRPEAARTGFHGIIPWLRDTLEETKSEGYREYMMQYMSATRMSALPRAQTAAGVAGGDDPDRGCGGASAGVIATTVMSSR